LPFFCKFEFKFDDIFKFELKFNAQILLPSSPKPYSFGVNHGFKKRPKYLRKEKVNLIKFTPNKLARKNQH